MQLANAERMKSSMMEKTKLSTLSCVEISLKQNETWKAPRISRFMDYLMTENESLTVLLSD